MEFQIIQSTMIGLGCFFIFMCILFNLAKACKRSVSKEAPRLPPGPWKLPFIGSLHHLHGSSLPHRSLQRLAKKHGPLMHLKLGEVPALVVSSPGQAKQVLKIHDAAFADRPDLLAPRIIFYDGSDMAFAPYGDFWRQMRKIIMVELLSAKNVKSYSHIRDAEVRRLVECIKTSQGQEHAINLTDKIYSMTSSIICRAALGKTYEGQDTMVELMKGFLGTSSGFDLADLFPSLKLLHFLSGVKPKLIKMLGRLDVILENIIHDHMERLGTEKMEDAEGREEDLIDVLLRVNRDGSLKFPISKENIKALIFDLFSGATDTSSATLEWAMSELLRNPKVMEKAQAELRETLKGKERIDESDIENLEYLKMVVKETLRLHPPFPLILRQCRETCEVGGYTIPAKTKLIVNIWSMGRDSEYWDEAENFKPERFTDGLINYMGSKFEYIPFGAGKRACPGTSFGIANVELPLAKLLYHFDWKLPTGIKPRDLDMTENHGLVASRKDKLFLIAKSFYP